MGANAHGNAANRVSLPGTLHLRGEGIRGKGSDTVISMDVIADSGCATVIPSPVMEIENLIRYAPCAVGLMPSAMECEARLRGL